MKCFIFYLVFSLFFLPNVYALNFAEASQFAYPEYSKRISMDFKNADLNDVLKIFSQQSGMNFIAAQSIMNKKLTLYLDNVPVEKALDRILSANNLTYEIQPGSDIFVVKELAKPTKQLLTRIYSLKNATVSSSKLNTTIPTCGTGSASGGAATGSDNGLMAAIKAATSGPDAKIIEDPRTNSLIITDIPSQFPIIEQTIARLDMPVPQIVIEVEMLDISKTTADKLGVKYGGTPLTFSGGQRDHVYPWNQNQLLDKGYEFEEAEYRVGTIDASGMTAMLQMLKTQTDTKYLARPRLLTLNNQTAEIKISTNEAIGISTQTSSSQSTAVQSVEAERVETGVFLTVTPQANILTNEIILAVVPRVIEARTGGTYDGKTFKDPEERGAKSILRVRNGETVIIGGLLRDNSTDVITKLPFLGDLPLIGSAFRHKDKSSAERELVIFLTPRILNETDTINTALTNYRPINREQDMPVRRKLEIDNALAIYEKNNL